MINTPNGRTHDKSTKTGGEEEVVAMIEIQHNKAIEVLNTETTEEWLIDSGASVHVTNSSAGMIDIEPTDEAVIVGNNTVIKANLKGTVYIKDTVTQRSIKLRSVLYVPNFRRNIISIGKLVENNLQVIMNEQL